MGAVEEREATGASVAGKTPVSAEAVETWGISEADETTVSAEAVETSVISEVDETTASSEVVETSGISETDGTTVSLETVETSGISEMDESPKDVEGGLETEETPGRSGDAQLEEVSVDDVPSSVSAVFETTFLGLPLFFLGGILNARVGN